MASRGPKVDVPPGTAGALLVAQTVAVPLIAQGTGLHVLVRRPDKNQDIPHLPRTWVSRPGTPRTDTGQMLGSVLPDAPALPGAIAAVHLEAEPAVRPAAGVISSVYVLLASAPQDTSRWVLLPVERAGELSAWDQAAITSARPIAKQLLTDMSVAAAQLTQPFTLGQLRSVYEAHFQVKLNPSNFARQALASATASWLTEVSRRAGHPGKAAALYATTGDHAPKYWSKAA